MEKILVIEDSAQIRDLFIASLESEGFYTIGAENGLVAGADDYLTKPCTVEQLLRASPHGQAPLGHRRPTGKTICPQALVRC